MEITRELGLAIRSARRERRLSQGELAAAAGCKQSQVSMVEHGTPGSLADEKLRAILNELEISTIPPPASPHVPRPVAGGGFCPDADCPSNVPYTIGDRLCFAPAPQQMPHPAAHCETCGERLETACPNPDCASPIRPGAACCPLCGDPYVCATAAAGTVDAAWIAARRETWRLLQAHATPSPS